MTAARVRPRRLKATPLREDFHRGAGSPLRVDEEVGIIHRIKILGWQSDNGRRYLPEAARGYLHLYDGAKCFCNHPDKPARMRDADDALGIWRKPVWESDGVYADLHYLKTHPMAARVVEDAKRGLGVFGMSHNADGEVERQGGTDVVGRITEVRSVDLVSDAATVSNLWEGRTVAKKHVKRLVEMYEDEMPAGAAPVAADGGGHEDDLFAAFKKLRDEDPEKANKILAMLKAEMGGGGDDEPVPEEDDSDKDKKDDEPKKAEEGRKRPPAGLTEAKAKQYCAVAGVDASKEVLEALVGSPEEKALSVLVLLKKSPGNGKPGSSAPRSSGGSRVPVTEGKAPSSAEEQAKSLLR